MNRQEGKRGSQGGSCCHHLCEVAVLAEKIRERLESADLLKSPLEGTQSFISVPVLELGRIFSLQPCPVLLVVGRVALLRTRRLRDGLRLAPGEQAN